MTQEEMKVLQQVEAQLEKLLDKQFSRSSRVWEVATKICVPLVLLLGGWIWNIDRQVYSNNKDVKDNQRALSLLSEKMDAQPPVWLREIVTDLKEQNTDILQRISRLEASIVREGR